MNSKIVTIMAVMLMFFSVPASTAFEIRGSVVDNQTGLVSWNAQNFAGFYYDIDKNISSETMTVTLTGSRTIAEGDLKYVSEKVPAEYKIHDLLGIKVNKQSDYQVLGWKGEKWVAVGGKANKLAQLGLEMDISEKITLVPGNAWNLGNGYELAIKAVDANTDPRQAWIVLSKDGKVLDDAIIQYHKVYEYTTKVLGDDNVLVFAVYIDSIFAGTTSDMIQFKYGWMIYPDTAKEVKTSDTYGAMEVTTAGANHIELRNKNSISLSQNSVVSIMDNMEFKVADNNSVLRFYPRINTETTVEATPIKAVVTTVAPIQTTAPPAPVQTTAVPVVTSTPQATAVPVTTTIVSTTEFPSTPITDKKTVPGFTGLISVIGLIGVCLLIKRRKI